MPEAVKIVGQSEHRACRCCVSRHRPGAWHDSLLLAKEKTVPIRERRQYCLRGKAVPIWATLPANRDWSVRDVMETCMARACQARFTETPLRAHDGSSVQGS
jgi:hypothetical protein